MDIPKLIKEIRNGDFKSLARALTLVENNHAVAQNLLKQLWSSAHIPVIGITGPPGAGKSTLINAILNQFSKDNLKIAVLAVDPSSPFNHGALLGDRIRMVKQHNNQNIFIRSVATRGAIGGLSTKTLQMIDVLKAGKFDLIIVETVGVGQSEVEIASLADYTLVVLVPESGDDIQQNKSGIMEIADGFVVNKFDREGADRFFSSLENMLQENNLNLPIFKTIAETGVGIKELAVFLTVPKTINLDKQKRLLKQKAQILLVDTLITKTMIKAFDEALEHEIVDNKLNLYVFIERWLSEEYTVVSKK